MVYNSFEPKNVNSGIFWKALGWKILVFFMTILLFLCPFWNVLPTFDMLIGHLICLLVIWYVY
jgi:hypothetical protein